MLFLINKHYLSSGKFSYNTNFDNIFLIITNNKAANIRI